MAHPGHPPIEVTPRGMKPIFKTGMLIYQSKVNLDEKILFGSIPHLVDPKIRKILVQGMFGNKDSTFPLVTE